MPMSRLYNFKQPGGPQGAQFPPNPTLDQLWSMGVGNRLQGQSQYGKAYSPLAQMIMGGMGGGGMSPQASLMPAPQMGTPGGSLMPFAPGSPAYFPQGGGGMQNPMLMSMASQALQPMFQLGLTPEVLYNTLIAAMQNQFGGY